MYKRQNQVDARALIATERQTLSRRALAPTDHDSLRAAITHRTKTIYQQAINERPEWLIETLTELDDRGTLGQLRPSQLRQLVSDVAADKDLDGRRDIAAKTRAHPGRWPARAV